jgi:predicted nucleic acid binding AN1-type Zn finger protein
MSYRQKEITTQEITNRKLIQMGAYTVPTSIPRNDKMKYNTDGSLYCTNLGPEDRFLNESLHCTNQGSEDRIPRNDKMTYDINGSLHYTN